VKPLPSSQNYATWLAIVRVLTGVAWLSHGIPKFTKSDEFMPPSGFMMNYIQHGMQVSSGPYRAFLEYTVYPHLDVFANLVRIGEVAVGIALVLGVLTRLGGLGGVLLTLNYMLARGTILSSSAVQSLDFCLLVLSLTSLVLPTGRVWGIDALLARPKNVPATVRAEFVQEPPLDKPTAPPNP